MSASFSFQIYHLVNFFNSKDPIGSGIGDAVFGGKGLGIPYLILAQIGCQLTTYSDFPVFAAWLS